VPKIGMSVGEPRPTTCKRVGQGDRYNQFAKLSIFLPCKMIVAFRYRI